MVQVLGIDLGTTNSCVALLENETPLVVPIEQGRYVLPSVVGFEEDGSHRVGSVAKRQAAVHAEHTVFAAKRLIGRKFDSPEAQQSIKAMPYVCVEGTHGDIRIRVRGRDYAVPEVSALVLSELKRGAEAHFGPGIVKAVITVPAYFNDHQRQATRDAGQIAGLEVIRVLNEPTAAALAYGALQDEGGSRRVVVYDLGGGTFDVSVLEISGGAVEVRATAGDAFLGGVDFDDRIVQWITARIEREHGITLARDPNALQRVREAAENAKIMLSENLETQIALPFLTTRKDGAPVHVQVTLERGVFESVVGDLLDRTMERLFDTLHAAALEPAEVDEVILVGGMTRMPAVQTRVQQAFDRKPSSGVHPDLVVAVGAAIQGALLLDEAPNTVLRDVTPHGLGIMALGGLAETVIPKDSVIPTEARKLFTTVRDNQESVKIVVYQGDSRHVVNNQVLGEFTLQGIRQAPRGEVQIEVRFHISADGLVGVSATDVNTGLAQSIEIQHAPTLDEDELRQMISAHQDQLAVAAPRSATTGET